MEPIAFKLSTSIKTHKGDIDELMLKPPRAKAFIKHGMPYATIREGDQDNPRVEFRFHPKVMFKFISDMTGHDESVLEEIASGDVQPLFWAVVEVLGQRPTNTST